MPRCPSVAQIVPAKIAIDSRTYDSQLRNGDTLISDQFNQRVIEVTPSCQIVFTQGELNMLGDGFDMLNGPYDAKDIDDFTGLTSPKELGEGEQGLCGNG